MKKESQLAIFYFCLDTLSQAFHDINVTEKSKLYVPYLME